MRYTNSKAGLQRDVADHVIALVRPPNDRDTSQQCGTRITEKEEEQSPLTQKIQRIADATERQGYGTVISPPRETKSKP